MANVMRMAWEIARSGQKKFGGSVKEYFAESLRIAWAIVKGERKVSVIFGVNHQPSGGKEWVAEITGRHPKYKFNREFLNPVERKWSSSGKTGTTYFKLEEGRIYEVNEPWKGRRFITVRNGEVEELDAKLLPM